MSVMIKGMEMRKSCHGCDLFSGEGFLCPLVIETTNDWDREVMYKRVDECPLVEIPTPHGRLIDADYIDGSGLIEWQKSIVKAEISQAPTVVEAEGVNE